MWCQEFDFRLSSSGFVPIVTGYVPQGYADYVSGEGWIGRRLLPPTYGPPIWTELRVYAFLPNGATRTVTNVSIVYSSPVTVSHLGMLDYRAYFENQPAGTNMLSQSSTVYSNVSSLRTDLVVLGDHELKLHRLRLEGLGSNPWGTDNCAVPTPTPTIGFCPVSTPTRTALPTAELGDCRDSACRGSAQVVQPAAPGCVVPTATPTRTATATATATVVDSIPCPQQPAALGQASAPNAFSPSAANAYLFSWNRDPSSGDFRFRLTCAPGVQYAIRLQSNVTIQFRDQDGVVLLDIPTQCQISAFPIFASLDCIEPVVSNAVVAELFSQSNNQWCGIESMKN
jgi:hypothetical protein